MPLKIDSVRVVRPFEDANEVEGAETRRYMKLHGIDNVRGGPDCNMILDAEVCSSQHQHSIRPR